MPEGSELQCTGLALSAVRETTPKAQSWRAFGLRALVLDSKYAFSTAHGDREHVPRVRTALGILSRIYISALGLDSKYESVSSDKRLTPAQPPINVPLSPVQLAGLLFIDLLSFYFCSQHEILRIPTGGGSTHSGWRSGPACESSFITD